MKKLQKAIITKLISDLDDRDLTTHLKSMGYMKLFIELIRSYTKEILTNNSFYAISFKDREWTNRAYEMRPSLYTKAIRSEMSTKKQAQA